MITLEDIHIGQNLYWVDTSNNVRSGPITEIRIKEDQLCCMIHGKEFDTKKLHILCCDAEIESAEKRIQLVKGEILEKAKKLKNLRQQKAESLTVKLSCIEIPDIPAKKNGLK